MRKVSYLYDLIEGDLVLIDREGQLDYIKYDGVTEMENLKKIGGQYITFSSRSEAESYIRNFKQKKEKMNNNIKIGATIGGIVIVIFLIIIFATKVSVQNTEIELRESVMAKEKVCESFHDMVWKTLTQKSQVLKRYSADFDSIYTHIMSERYQNNNNVLFNWIQERDPNFSVELYKDLSRSIESLRVSFHKEQEILIDQQRNYNTYIQKFPNRMFLDADKIEVTVVTSTNTQKVYETGTDDNVDLGL